MNNIFRQSAPALFAVALLCVGTTVRGQERKTEARAQSEEILEWWNHIGNKLIAMAQDFPEDKYDFKVQKDERTFAQNLLHVAAVDFDVASRLSGSQVGPDFGQDKHNPSRQVYRTKDEVVALLHNAVVAGAAVIKQQGDAGLDKTMPFSWETGRHVVHNSYAWLAAIIAPSTSANWWCTIALTV